MIINQLDSTELNISAIGLGTWVFAGDLWQGADEPGCVEAVRAALDRGVNFIDTAPVYGNGLSEKIVAKAIKGRRKEVVLATKCGLRLDGEKIIYDLSRASILKEVDESLSRLGVDVIDLYQCHWPDAKTPVEETMKALSSLVAQGKIRYIGVSNFDKSLLAEARRFGSVVTNQCEYSLLKRGLEKEMRPYCVKEGVGVIAYGVLGGGILTGKYSKEPQFQGADVRKFFYKNYKGAAFQAAKKLSKYLASFGHPPAEAAINWVRQQPSVCCALVGARNKEQAEKNIQAASWSLSEEQLKEIAGFQVQP